MDRICLQSSTCDDIKFLVSLDVRISKEKVDGLQRVDIALSKSEVGGKLEDSVLTSKTPLLYDDECGKLFINGIEIEVYERDSSDAHMRVSEKLCFQKKKNMAELAIGIPYVHSLLVHSEKPLYALVTSKLCMETDRKRVYVPLELFTVSDESEGVFDLKKG
nr:MAG TPA: hypothetical protein [Caudoviricetes sp.]